MNSFFRVAVFLIPPCLVGCANDAENHASSAVEPVPVQDAEPVTPEVVFEQGLHFAGDVSGIIEDDGPIRMVEVSPPDPAVRGEVVSNGPWSAYVAPAPPDDQRQIEYVYLSNGARTFRIEGLPLGHRPLGALVWLTPGHLQFDRWSNPHFGIRYVFDVQQSTMAQACSFADDHFIESQRPVNLQ